MNKTQIHQYVLRYLEATKSQIIEKSPYHVTVKLSPQADKDLTNRSYYWSFVERTGAEPETMTYSFVFDKEKLESEKKNTPIQLQPSPPQKTDSILGRYFGLSPQAPDSGRILSEEVSYGSRRLDQIFQAVSLKGKYVNLFEEPVQREGHVASSYTSWLGVNFKLEFTCDMKRDELHSLGICLSTGEIANDFYSLLVSKQLTPKLPANTHLREMISLQRALTDLEHYIDKKIKTCNHQWAAEANERLQDELARIEDYYEDLIKSAEEDKKTDIEAQYNNRKQEIEWQYRPRIEASVINCGLFHLLNDSFFGL